MKICVLSVGKPRDTEAEALYRRYAERVVRFGVGFDTVWVPEVRSGGRFSEAHALQREARAIQQRLDGPGPAVAVDRRGTAFTSKQLARRLERWASPRATFIVGGPLGLHGSVLERANSRWSLSSLTFPHELARVLVAEQLYRALTLLRGLPYHR